MRKKNPVINLIGVIMAIAGAVIIIHTVPVFVWYIVLVVLVLVFAVMMLNM